jgi:hypothetical protein
MSHRQQEDKPIRARDQTMKISPWAEQWEWRKGGDTNESKENILW